MAARDGLLLPISSPPYRDTTWRRKRLNAVRRPLGEAPDNNALKLTRALWCARRVTPNGQTASVPRRPIFINAPLQLIWNATCQHCDAGCCPLSVVIL